MKKTLSLIILLIISASVSFAGEEIPTPTIILESMKVYKESGAEKFVDRFVEGSMLENEPTKVSGMKANFLAYAAQFGDFHDYEIILNQQITSKTTRTFMAIHYEIGVLFCRMDSYTQPDGESVILRGRWDSDSWDVFPWKAVQRDSDK